MGRLITGASIAEILASVRRSIESGALGPGAVLPAVRVLAEELGVNRNTVAAAYQRLSATGLIVCDRRGCRVSVPAEPASLFRPPDYGPGVRDLSFGNPDPKLLPSPVAALAAAGKKFGQSYGDEMNVPELVALAEARARRDGLPMEVAETTVVNGAMDGIERVLMAHLSPGDAVAVEEPCFTRILHLLRAIGLSAIGVPVDEEGLRPDGFAAALKANARAVILTPVAHNPTGATLSPERVRDLRKILKTKPDLLVIEDDHFGQLVKVPVLSLVTKDRNSWAVLRSSSKHLGPDFRLAVLHGDATTLRRVRLRQAAGVGWVSHILQRAVFELEADSAVRGQIDKAGDLYAQRRIALRSALDKRGVASSGREGFNIWISLSNEAQVAQSLLTKGWAVRTGEAFRPSGRGGLGLRITASTLEPHESEQLATDLVAATTPAYHAPLS